jgi:membrane protease YdiL (CAAX protease family)
VQLPFGVVVAMCIAFLVAALCEEVGWCGYATARMQARWGIVRTGLLLGVVWGLWHVVPYIQAHRSSTWIAWQVFKSVLLRLLITWIYDSTGKSVFAASLLHASDNLATFLFPSLGSHYDPRVDGVLLAMVVIVIGMSGRTTHAKTMVRPRMRREPGGPRSA